jgi:hypothetical protein
MDCQSAVAGDMTGQHTFRKPLCLRLKFMIRNRNDPHAGGARIGQYGPHQFGARLQRLSIVLSACGAWQSESYCANTV